VCSVVSGLCTELIHLFKGVLPGVCLLACDRETSTVRRPRPDLGCCSTKKKFIQAILPKVCTMEVPSSNLGPDDYTG
jgi:hypothetical protein